MKIKYIIITLLVLAVAVSAAAQSDEMPETRISYLVCDWGLLTIEVPTEQSPTFIVIDTPADYSAVEGTTFTVAGTGAGLVEQLLLQKTGGRPVKNP